MHSVLSAELAMLLHFDSVGIVLLVLHIVVIALFALGTSKRNLVSSSVCHSSLSPEKLLKNTPFSAGCFGIVSHLPRLVKQFLTVFKCF